MWAQEDVLSFVADKVRDLKRPQVFGICHGVRNGFEVKFLNNALSDIKANVIGTEISEVAKEHENTIQWDFHDIKGEWVGNVDFIYSNAFDHSCKPEFCLSQWMKCIAKHGICFLEWTNSHDAGGVGEADCFRASLDEYVGLAKDYHVEVAEICGKRNAINATSKTRIVMITH